MDEVSSRAQFAGEIRIGIHGFQRRRSSTIAILTDQRIDGSGLRQKIFTPGARMINSAPSASAMRVR